VTKLSSENPKPPAGPSPRERDGCLLVFTKPARSGRVKTRLIGDLSAEQAAQLHAAFVADVVEVAAQGSFALRLAWALDEGEAIPIHELATGGKISGLRQRGDSLGDRLYEGLSRAAEEHAAVAALGSDHPTVPLELLEEAFCRLEQGAEVVIGPATDGGYYLIACSRGGLRRELFEEIPWSTEKVLEATTQAAEALGLRLELLAEGSDVDTPEDLRLLVQALESKENLRCPKTREVLSSWGRLERGVEG